jgi:starch phosphorylase
MTADRGTRRIAYLSMEIGLDSGMPTYSGGLGVLAGDTLRAAADLALPVVGISLLYKQGFFRQHLDIEGYQTESAYNWDPHRYLKQLDVRVSIHLEGRTVALGAWIYPVRGATGATVPIYFLDADRPENDPEDRALTGQLYGGDQRYRLEQETILGLGGLALLRALGHQQIETYHMNEGHCALVTIGLLAEIAKDGNPAEATEEDWEMVRSRCVFTTHTPVPAGHDRFHFDLVHQVLDQPLADAVQRLPCWTEEYLNMTYLGLFFSRFANGVARRHGQVAQAMYPGYEIHSITNGVHAANWASEPLAALYDREMPEWRVDNNYLRHALDVPLDHVLEAHAQAKRELMAAVQTRAGVKLDPAVMTIGFARRAATYKRADFVFSDLDMIRTIATEAGPLQFIFAGKAHPHDEPAKALIRSVFDARDKLLPTVHVAYLPEHDMALGKLLCSGVDLWLNNPQKPLEASGTSGMKAALNGVPSLSVLDGWWPEGWIEGATGWAIGSGEVEGDQEEELASLYNKLRYVIVPLYYGSPMGYARVMRSTIAANGSYFTAQRMMQQYVRNAYRLPYEDSEEA